MGLISRSGLYLEGLHMDGLASNAIIPQSPKVSVDPAQFIALQVIIQVLVVGTANLVSERANISAAEWLKATTTNARETIQRSTMANHLRWAALEHVENILGSISFE